VIKRTIEISQDPLHLSVRLDQLILNRNGAVVDAIPCEDLGVVVVDQQQTTYTHAALGRLAQAGATMVLCGPDHLPTAMVLPLATHSCVVWRIAEQLAVTKPMRKRLWRQVVQAKIRAQALNLERGRARTKLLALAREVKSADVTNVEAQAAKVYWRHWLPDEEFRRNPETPGTNALLNYGYAILRAAIARALVAAGLLPALGLHHHNRANAFCLADDLIEPLRPLVDRRVRNLCAQGCQSVTRAAKAELLQLLVERVQMGSERGPLMVNLHRMVASLIRCYRGESTRLDIPRRSGLESRPDSEQDPSPAEPA